MAPVIRFSGVLATALVVCACTNRENIKTGQERLACMEQNPVPASLRLLTRLQYDNTVRDLLGVTTQPSVDFQFPPENQVMGFSNIAGVHLASPLLVENYMRAAESLSEGAVTNGLPGMEICPAGGDPYAFGTDFVQQFGLRAFRRPLTSAEVTPYQDLFTQTLQAHDCQSAARLVVQAILQSPQFLYRADAVAAPTPQTGAIQLGSYEMASRLSYFLWNSMPDAALLEAAANDELIDPQHIEAEARRLLDDPRARPTVIDFHRQWLEFDHFNTVAPVLPNDVQLSGVQTSDLVSSWRASLERFIDYVFWEKGGDVGELLRSPAVFVDSKLAPVYGLSYSGPDQTRADFVGTRAGLLTQPALMALLSHPDQTAPVRRGLFVRERLLCQDLPPPPPGMMNPQPPPLSITLTTRERFQQHKTDPNCALCHDMMDGIGFGLENYDQLGRFRSYENGHPIDTSGELVLTVDPALEGTFAGPLELSDRLSQSPQVYQCLATQWYRYATGRIETDADLCSIQQATDALVKSGGNLRELLVNLALTDGFRFRTPDKEGH